MEDFYDQFKEFYDKVNSITNVRFAYMKELYNLGLEQFPENLEILNFQQNNQGSIQTGNTKLKKNWSDEDKRVLIWIIGKYMAYHKRDFKQICEEDWQNISSMMLRRDSFQCKQKWLQMLKLPLQQAPWGQNEDEALVRIISEFQAQNKGNKWSQIATELNKTTGLNVHRNGKQCRERWNNHLNPSINRNPWQQLEDLELMRLAIQNGKKWALISKKLKLQRSENNVKNRFNCLMRKEKSGKNIPQSQDESDNDNQESYMSDPSAEELSPEEIKQIQAIIKKIEWRMKQDGTTYEIKQEHQDQVSKKVQLDRRALKSKQQLQNNPNNNKVQNVNNFNNININIENFTPSTLNQHGNNNSNQIQFQVLEYNQNEDQSQLSFCLVNRDKGFIYFLNQEQFNNYVNTQNQISNNQLMNIPSFLAAQPVNSNMNYQNNIVLHPQVELNQQQNPQTNNFDCLSDNQNLNSFYLMHSQVNLNFNQPSQVNFNQPSQVNYNQMPPTRSQLNLPNHLYNNFTSNPQYLANLNYHVTCYQQPQQPQMMFQSQPSDRLDL
ncbi:unnamed protein product [Paramecium octaurelia]|uniref:Homeodomain protein n=1 Tax=Paramecium octaurelia TaxID=43137 RepID=A0A8S1UH05_PAROT|nr:unnamed protein product [Paramecium octaurelia]